MVKRLMLVVFAALLLTSCTPLQFNTEMMMRPPRLTVHQSEVYAALENAIGTDFKFKYPQSGDFRSAFVLKDLDGDGVEEYLVFYETGAIESETRIHVLGYENGSWVSKADRAGVSSDVDFIRFGNLMSGTRENIIIGWVENQVQKKIQILTYDDSGMVENYSSEYAEARIISVSGKILVDLVILQNRANGRTLLRLVSARNSRELDVVSEVQLPRDMLAISNIVFGKYYSDKDAVFIDYQQWDDKYATAIIALENREFIYLTDENVNELLLRTVRPMDLRSGDFTGSDIITVPSCHILPGYDEMQDMYVYYLTEYLKYVDGEFVKEFAAVVNQNAGYMLRFPERWVGEVTVRSQFEDNEWRFYEYDHEMMTDKEELLKIRVYAPTDHRDRFDTEIFLGKKGAFEYYGVLPRPAENPFEITENDLKEMFSLLD